LSSGVNNSNSSTGPRTVYGINPLDRPAYRSASPLALCAPDSQFALPAPDSAANGHQPKLDRSQISLKLATVRCDRLKQFDKLTLFLFYLWACLSIAAFRCSITFSGIAALASRGYDSFAHHSEPDYLLHEKI
uniref:CASP-like protein n=1 Tax=Echinostoma caproni TaxID=27848 RepID=A0A183AXL9_9TREM